MNIYWACLSLVLAVTLSRGGRPEQLAGLILVAGAALSLASVPDPHKSFRTVEWPLFSVDLASFTCFLLVALRANRWWPMCICGIKLVPLAGHIAKAFEPRISYMVYGSLTGAWTYPIMIVVAIAVARHQLRLRDRGEDRAWREPG